MRIFISHSSEDKVIANLFTEFLKKAGKNITVFCSSGMDKIRPGADYVKEINKEQDTCDLFIPLLSRNYYNSRYSMIELGYEYSRFVHDREDLICPFCLPGISDALIGTPLSHLEVYALNDKYALRAFLEELENRGEEISVTANAVASFLSALNQAYLESADIFENAQMISCCSDGDNPNAIVCTKKENNVTVNFNLFANGKNNRPDFISTVFRFYEDLDLYTYLMANEHLKLHFVLNSYTDSIQHIQVEFQTVDNRMVGTPFAYEIKEGRNVIDLSLAELKKFKRDLSCVVNICFVVFRPEFTEDEGMYAIEELKIV